MAPGRRPACSAATVAALWLAATLLGACRPREEVAEIEVAGFGTIHFRFRTDAAPLHVEAFKQLSRAGFYDGTTFPRVAPGSLIQGGESGSGTEVQSMPALAPEPGDLRHHEGSVSMVSDDGPAAPTRQFLIVLRDHADWKTELDGRHTIFGQVIDGLEVARTIAWTPRDEHD